MSNHLFCFFGAATLFLGAGSGCDNSRTASWQELTKEEAKHNALVGDWRILQCTDGYVVYEHNIEPEYEKGNIESFRLYKLTDADKKKENADVLNGLQPMFFEHTPFEKIEDSSIRHRIRTHMCFVVDQKAI